MLGKAKAKLSIANYTITTVSNLKKRLLFLKHLISIKLEIQVMVVMILLINSYNQNYNLIIIEFGGFV